MIMNYGGGNIPGTKRDFDHVFSLSFLAHETLKVFITVWEQMIITQLQWSKADRESASEESSIRIQKLLAIAKGRSSAKRTNRCDQ